MQKDYSDNNNQLNRIFEPIEQKSFKNALIQFFKTEFPQLGGEMILQLVADKIEAMTSVFFPKISHLSMGQMLWFAIDENQSSGYGKSMQNVKIKPVVLSVVHPNDIERFKVGLSSFDIKDHAMARLYKEAKEQGAVLAESDISLIMHMTIKNVSKRTVKYEQKFGTILPRRGTVHDLGRSVTHKKTICKKRFIEHKSISQIAKETNHSPNSVNRYTNDLNRVEFCLNKNLSIDQISFVTNLSPSLTLEYVSLIDEIKKQKIRYENTEEDLPF